MQILGIPFEVEIVPDNILNTGYIGHNNPPKAKITILEGLPEDIENEAVLHEVLHVIDNELLLHLSHTKLSSISRTLYAIAKENDITLALHRPQEKQQAPLKPEMSEEQIEELILKGVKEEMEDLKKRDFVRFNHPLVKDFAADLDSFIGHVEQDFERVMPLLNHARRTINELDLLTALDPGLLKMQIVRKKGAAMFIAFALAKYCQYLSRVEDVNNKAGSMGTNVIQQINSENKVPNAQYASAEPKKIINEAELEFKGTAIISD